MEEIRGEVIELLKSNGVSEDFLSKPGIVELCIREYSQGRTDINFDGERLRFGNYTFETDSISYYYETEVLYGNNYSSFQGNISLNEFGIPIAMTEYSETHGWMDGGLSSREELVCQNGKIIRKSYPRDEEYCNLGKAILDVRNTPLFNSREKISADSVLEEFDKNAEYIVQNYPQTEAYYKQLREQVIKAIREDYLSDPMRASIDITGSTKVVISPEEYQNLIQKLCTDIEGLNEKNKSLSTRLGIALNFCERVRDSKMGKIFFGKDIKRLPKGTIEDSDISKE